jgi:hypothetical protein
MLKKFADLIDVKSIVTLTMTIALVAMLFVQTNPPKELLALYCTSYGSIITYFFTKKSDENKGE